MHLKRQSKTASGLSLAVYLLAYFNLYVTAFGQPKLSGVIDLHAHCAPRQSSQGY